MHIREVEYYVKKVAKGTLFHRMGIRRLPGRDHVAEFVPNHRAGHSGGALWGILGALVVTVLAIWLLVTLALG